MHATLLWTSFHAHITLPENPLTTSGLSILMHRGFILFDGNTKNISSSAVKKFSIFYECVARLKMLIFSPHEMKYIRYFQKKKSFYFILTEILNFKAEPNFSLVFSRLI